MTIESGSEPASHAGDPPLLRGEVAFRLLVEAVADYAIFLLGPDGRVLTWNRGAQRIKGYTAEEIIGQHFSRFYTPEDRAAGRPQFLLGRAARDGRSQDEGWRVRKDGSRFWADVVITALSDGGDVAYAYVKITRDLTERRAAEEQQRNLLAEQRARQAAEEALAARDRFLGIASHELKTPVASLQLATEALLRAHQRDRLDPERLETGLRRVTAATDRLAELMAELLDVGRLTGDDRPLNRVPTELRALVRDVAARFDGAAGHERVRVTADREVWIEADPARLDQVIANLVDNALKYSGSPQPVDVLLTADGAEAVILVVDRGIGLEPGTEHRIFEAFGRGANAEHYQGIGLGLYIAQEIVARHGGRIEARSRTDAPGSTFTVTLPLAGPSAS